MNRKVTFLRVHDLSALFNGIGPKGLPGNLSSNQLPDPKKPIPGLSMTEGHSGVEITIAGAPQVQIIPYTNIQKYDVVDANYVVPDPVAPKPGIWAKKSQAEKDAK